MEKKKDGVKVTLNFTPEAFDDRLNILKKKIVSKAMKNASGEELFYIDCLFEDIVEYRKFFGYVHEKMGIGFTGKETEYKKPKNYKFYIVDKSTLDIVSNYSVTKDGIRLVSVGKLGDYKPHLFTSKKEADEVCAAVNSSGKGSFVVEY